MKVNSYYLFSWLLRCAQFTAAATPSSSYAVKTFKPSNCPAPTPVGQRVFRSNKNQTKTLGGGVAIYNGTKQRLGEFVFSLTDTPDALFNLAADKSAFTVTFPDGGAVKYEANSSSITIFEPGCKRAETYTKVKHRNVVSTSAEKRTSEDMPIAVRQMDESDVQVTVTIQDQCGTPVTTLTPQLDCTPIMYPQEDAGSGPVFGTPDHYPLDNNGDGTYNGSCAITTALQTSNRDYKACVTEDRKGIDHDCGPLQKTVNEAKDFLGKIQKFVKTARVILANSAKAFKFYKNYCKFLQDPNVAAQLDAADCGLPASLAIGVQAVSFSKAVGTVQATPAQVQATATASIASTSCQLISDSSFETGGAYWIYNHAGTTVGVSDPGEGPTYAQLRQTVIKSGEDLPAVVQTFTASLEAERQYQYSFDYRVEKVNFRNKQEYCELYGVVGNARFTIELPKTPMPTWTNFVGTTTITPAPNQGAGVFMGCQYALPEPTAFVDIDNVQLYGL